MLPRTVVSRFARDPTGRRQAMLRTNRLLINEAGPHALAGHRTGPACLVEVAARYRGGDRGDDRAAKGGEAGLRLAVPGGRRGRSRGTSRSAPLCPGNP